MSYFIYKGAKVYYGDKGQGSPLIIIHGNSVSSKMHGSFARKLSKFLRVISPDLPGHGKSDRIESWPHDFWFEHSHVIIELIRHLNLGKADLLGYSGGALIALNAALEQPDLIGRVIADSFEGESSVASFAENIFADRAKDKKKIAAKIFWFLMHGRDWGRVVDNDSKVIYGHHRKYGRFFHKDLSEIKCPVLLTGSTNDEYIDDFDKFYGPLISKIPDLKCKIYDTGKHPAALTVGQEFIDDLELFLSQG